MKRTRRLPAGQRPRAVEVVTLERDLGGGLLLARRMRERRAVRVRIAQAGKSARAGERILARLTLAPEDGGEPTLYEARILHVIGSGRREAGAKRRFLAVVEKNGRTRLTPTDRRARRSFFLDAKTAAPPGALVMAERLAGERARIGEILEKSCFPHKLGLIAAHSHGLRMDFPAPALKEAGQAKAFPGEGHDYEDLTGLPFVTIDPEDARDHDDAVWAASGPQDGFEIRVAIADVAHYVPPGSALDEEARLRGNSTYLAGHVLPMLPEKLSNDLCSLRAGAVRPCLVAHMEFDRNGRKRSHRIGRALIRPAANLTYEEMQEALEGRALRRRDGPGREVLESLGAGFAALMIAREAREPLALISSERRVVFSPSGEVEIEKSFQIEAHRLIEEFMIQANVAAAETLQQHGAAGIYRIHALPPADKLETLSAYLAPLNLKAPKDPGRAAAFNRLLAKGEEMGAGALVSNAVLRSQSQAEYSAQTRGHFGLNLPLYTHFTSPIRRYADLLVHRALIACLKLPGAGGERLRLAELGEIARHISGTERLSQYAEYDTLDRYAAVVMAEHLGETFSTRLAGASRAGAFVEVGETGAEGLIPFSRLGRERFRLDPRRLTLTGQDSKTRLHPGIEIQARLEEVSWITGALRLSRLEE